MDFGLIENERVRELVVRLHAAWDGGPVKITGTISDGEQIAGFRVIHIPGHAPGQIALFRDSDRMLIAADAIYTLDAETGQSASARVPHPFSKLGHGDGAPVDPPADLAAGNQHLDRPRRSGDGGRRRGAARANRQLRAGPRFRVI